MDRDVARPLFAEQRANAGNYLAGAGAVADDAIGRFARIAERRWAARQKAHTGAGIGNDRGQRLVDLMGNRGGKLGHRRQPQRARQLGLRVVQRLLGALAVGQIHDRADDLFLAHRIGPDFAQRVHMPDRAAVEDDPDLTGKIRTAFDCHRHRRVEADSVVGVHLVPEQLK